MKEQILKIAQYLEQGTVTESEAQNLLLGLFGVVWQSEQLKAYAEFLANTYAFQNYSNKDLAFDFCDSL